MTPEELGRRVWELRGPLLRLTAGILRNPQDAEDAAADAVLRAFERIGTLRSDEAFRPWLMTIAARCCCDRLRRARRETPRADVEPLCPPAPPHGPGLMDLIAALPPGERTAVTLYYYEGLGIREVAQALGVPRPAASMRLTRGRRRLRGMLEAEGRDEA